MKIDWIVGVLVAVFIGSFILFIVGVKTPVFSLEINNGYAVTANFLGAIGMVLDGIATVIMALKRD